MLTGAESAQLLGPAGERLAALGITAEWPAELLMPGTVAAHISVAPRSATGSGTFSLADAADLTWQLDLDGEPLTDAGDPGGRRRRRRRPAAARTLGRPRRRDPAAGPRSPRRPALRRTGPGRGTHRPGHRGRTGHRLLAATGALADLVAALRGASSDCAERAAARTTSCCPAGWRRPCATTSAVAVHWLVRMTSAGFGALLADDMGLGKTLTVIAYRLVRASHRAVARRLPRVPAGQLGTGVRALRARRRRPPLPRGRPVPRAV